MEFESVAEMIDCVLRKLAEIGSSRLHPACTVLPV